MTVREKPRCGKLGTRSRKPCGRPEGHATHCAAVETIDRRRANERALRLTPAGREQVNAIARKSHRKTRGTVEARNKAHAYHIKVDFGITADQYWATYALQDSHCAICKIATGKAKKLAVDHDHGCRSGHPKAKGCPSCVRGLLCSRCNRFLGQMHDDVSAFKRAIEYLENPPFQEMLRSMN